MKYPLLSRILHWLMAVIILVLLAVGIYMTKFISSDSESRMAIYNLHKSFGVLALILVTIRIINRFINKPPALPETIIKIEVIASHLAHGLLYLFMIIIPLSGYLMSNSFGYPVYFFSIQMPFLIAQNFELGKIFAQIHEIAAYLLIATIVLHVCGVIKHRFFDKPENDVLKRMI